MLLMYLTQLIDNGSLRGRNTSLEQDALRSFIALPLYYVNLSKMRPVDENFRLPDVHRVKGHLARELDRIIISSGTLFTFSVLATVTMGWCLCVLVYGVLSRKLPPNTSQYSEIDFASKSVSSSEDHDGIMEVCLKGLGNAASKEIEERIKGRKMYVRCIATEEGMTPEAEGVVVIATDGKGESLKARRKYF